MQEDTCTDFKLKPWQVGLATSKASRGAAARPDDGVSHSGCEAADVTDPGLPLRRPVRWRGKNRRRFSKPPPQRGGADDRRGGGSRAEASLRSTYDGHDETGNFTQYVELGPAAVPAAAWVGERNCQWRAGRRTTTQKVQRSATGLALVAKDEMAASGRRQEGWYRGRTGGCSCLISRYERFHLFPNVLIFTSH